MPAYWHTSCGAGRVGLPCTCRLAGALVSAARRLPLARESPQPARASAFPTVASSVLRRHLLGRRQLARRPTAALVARRASVAAAASATPRLACFPSGCKPRQAAACFVAAAPAFSSRWATTGRLRSRRQYAERSSRNDSSSFRELVDNIAFRFFKGFFEAALAPGMWPPRPMQTAEGSAV